MAITFTPSFDRRTPVGVTPFKRPERRGSSGLPTTGGRPSGLMLEDNQNGNWVMWFDSSGRLHVTDSATYAAYSDVSGAAYNTAAGSGTVAFINDSVGTLLFGDGTAALPSIAFTNEPSSGLYRASAGTVSLQVLGVSRFFADGTSTAVKATDGGGYLLVQPQVVIVNSAVLHLANGGTAMFRFTAPTITGQVGITNGAGSTGVGWDVATDNVFKVRTRAQTGDAVVSASFHISSASSVLTIAANVITPTGSVHHVGAGLIKTITVPASFVGTGTITIIPDAAFTYDATDNIVVPGGGGTATINRPMTFTWDGAKWAPSY